MKFVCIFLLTLLLYPVSVVYLQTAENYNDLGKKEIDKSNYQNALVMFNRAIELDENYAAAYINRANVNSILKKYSDALSDYKRAIGLEPWNASLYTSRGKMQEVFRIFFRGRFAVLMSPITFLYFTYAAFVVY